MAWQDLMDAASLAPGANRTVAGVTVFNHEGRLHACETRCPHMGHPMAKGTIRDGVITCAWHRWDFDLAHGGCYRGGTDDLRVYPIRIEGGRVRIDRGDDAVDRAARERRLRESLLSGDAYLQAKELARLLAAGATPAETVAIVAEHEFRHSLSAHRDATAASELQAVLDAARLAALVPGEDAVQALMLGIRNVGASTGERPAVAPLPGPVDAPRLEALFTTYAREPSPLGLERILLTLAGDRAALERAVLAAATSGFLVDRPSALRAVMTWLDAGEAIGAGFDPQRHAVLAWALGEGRGTPDAEAHEAIAWLDGHAARLADPALAAGRSPIDADTVAALLDEPRVGGAFARVLAWCGEGVAWASLVDALSLTFARRFARLPPGNGGLWDSAAEGVALCQALRRAGACAGGAFRLRALLAVVCHLHRTRWLPSPTPFDAGAAAAGGWPEYEAAFTALDAREARRQAIAALGREPDRAAAAGRWLAPMLREDLEADQLRLLAATVDEVARQREWQPYLAGAIGWLLDAKNGRTVQAATRFGRSFA